MAAVARFIARIVSPGLRTVKNTAMLACEPEWGWTFTWSQWKSSFARSRAVILRFVDDVAAAVVPVGGVALRVFVREDGSRGGQYRRRHEILGSDEFDSLPAVSFSPVR